MAIDSPVLEEELRTNSRRPTRKPLCTDLNLPLPFRSAHPFSEMLDVRIGGRCGKSGVRGNPFAVLSGEETSSEGGEDGRSVAVLKDQTFSQWGMGEMKEEKREDVASLTFSKMGRRSPSKLDRESIRLSGEKGKKRLSSSVCERGRSLKDSQQGCSATGPTSPRSLATAVQMEEGKVKDGSQRRDVDDELTDSRLNLSSVPSRGSPVKLIEKGQRTMSKRERASGSGIELTIFP